MRWLALPLFVLAALVGYYGAHWLRARVDRSGGAHAASVGDVPATTPEDVLRAFADDHRGTAAGARALHLWTTRATSDAETIRRRAYFRTQYPQSWIHRAWDAEARR